MISIEKCNKLLDSGFSLITASANKKPNMKSWKPYQTIPITKQEFSKAYSSIDTTAKTEIVGILTGYNQLEVIDIDLKVFPTLPEQEAFWKELYSYMKDNIDDFDKKFVIYKTKNQGYHILYRCEQVAGNTKIAVLQGHTQAVIESRGKGGYVVIYDNKISPKDYLNISTISDRDRDILWTICRTYNHVAETETIQPDRKVSKEFVDQDLTTWQDYNQRHSIWDVISDDFKIVRKLAKHTIILRHGATSTQSGYVYTDSGCMFLFTTGTIYPHEKLISPFVAYTYKYHHGNFTESARDLYSKGYGSRRVKPIPKNKIQTVINTDDLIFPIDIFPAPVQTYMLECKKTINSSIDYMGCSMLWAVSLIVGNTIRIRTNRKFTSPCTVWLAVVGKAGIGKTPSIENIISPLKTLNGREIKQYIKQYEKWQAYDKMDKEERKQVEDVSKPAKSQFIVDDITLEALVDLHSQSKNAIGVFRDELNGWFKDMNKYREGSDLEFWLSTWSGSSVTVNRITRAGSHIDKPLIPVLGGIQPSVLTSVYTDENKDNGFLDRMLLSYPELEVDYYSDEEVSFEANDWFENNMISMFDHFRQQVMVINQEDEIVPYIAHLSPDAKVEWKRIFNNLTDLQRSDEENEYMKSMLPKQKNYIPRFAMLIHALDCYIRCKHEEYLLVSKDAILKAEKLSKYFIAMAKKIKVNTMEVKDMKSAIKATNSMSKKEQFLTMFRENPELNKKEAAELLNVSLTMIYRYLSENG
jgi:hypothetical protein